MTIVNAPTWLFLDSDRSTLMSNKEFDGLESIKSRPGNYLNVISSGPYDILPDSFVTVVYSFVAGHGLEGIQKNMDAAVKRSLAPDNLSATPSKNAVDLEWLPPINPDVSGYRIYRSLKSDSEYSNIAQLPTGAISYSDTDVKKGITYYYVVTAISSSDQESTYSNEVKSSSGAAPSSPKNLSFKITSGKPVLHWEDSADEDITGYRIYRNSTGESPWTPIATVDKSVQSYTDPDTYDGNTYYYTVVSVSLNDLISEYSNVISVTANSSHLSTAMKSLNSVKAAPNPCTGDYVKLINLTNSATINLYTQSGELVRTIYHSGGSGYEEWDLRNNSGHPVASGIYIYYIESYKTEGTGKLVTSGKIAVIRSE